MNYIYFIFASQGEDSSGQRYSADPTGLLTERGAKGDKDQDDYISSMRDKNNSGYFALWNMPIKLANILLKGNTTECLFTYCTSIYNTLTQRLLKCRCHSVCISSAAVQDCALS